MDSKLAKILEFVDSSEKELFQDVVLEKITIKNQANRADVYLKSESILSYPDAASLEKHIIKYFQVMIGAIRVTVYFKYGTQTIDSHLLEDYHQGIVEYIAQHSYRIAALKSINKQFSENNICFYLGNKEEAEGFSQLVKMLGTEFKRYGIGFVQLRTEISEFETPISEEIERINKLDTQKIIRDQIMYENSAEEQKSKEPLVFSKRPKKHNPINGPVTALKDIPATEAQLIEFEQKNSKKDFVVEGVLVQAEVRDIKSYKLYHGIITDGTDSIVVKSFVNLRTPGLLEHYEKGLATGFKVRIYGNVEYDRFERDVVLNIQDSLSYGLPEKKEVVDNAPMKRVELHAHTKMSSQDGVMDIEDYVRTAIRFGHKALAVTDHFNVQALPDLAQIISKIGKESGIKPIFGVEGNLVDEEGFNIALTNDVNFKLSDATYVVYDFETTGFSAVFNEIIEIGAVKIKNGTIVDSFSEFIKPEKAISKAITDLTSISNDDVRNARDVAAVLPEFKKFIEGCCLVAHNATFDNSHLYENMKRLGIYEKDLPSIDTLQLARVRYSDRLKRFRLDNLAKFFNVDLNNHHRAVHDAQATAEIFIKMLKDLLGDKITEYQMINSTINNEEAYKLSYPTHFTILVKNEEGKKNLNKIVSDSHTVHFHQTPRILKSFLESHREGLLLGSGCYNGVVFDTAMRKGDQELADVISFYDYLEVQPPEVYRHLIEADGDPDMDKHIIEAIKRIINAGVAAKKIVVATGDVHHLTREDLVFREIFVDAPQVGGGHHDLYNKTLGSQHFRTTDEMLECFNFLPQELAYEIVVTNSNKIADMIEKFPLFPPKLFAPADNFMEKYGIPSVKVALKDLCYETAHQLYGEHIPEYIVDRLEKELKSIIDNEFSSNYYIAHLLVKRSHDDGYVVGSRGSVGSSLTATFMRITEVNPLAPHYVCPHCFFTAFKLTNEEKKQYQQSKEAEQLDEILQSVDSGCDLPEMKCPICGQLMNREGFDIPFETFLGFSGDKVPDIDLNFSGDYQAKAHEFCRELFGVDHAFRAGTIATIAEKTAYGYVKGWLERQNRLARNAEITRLAKKIEGVKRSTGQHPGGIVVVPQEIEYTDIIPVQFPADDLTAAWRTSHYDYHKFESNLLKLDILGHDDPTMIRHLMNFVEANPSEFPFKTVEEIPLSDPEVLKLFSNVSSLGIESSQIHNDIIATTGLPEFGTSLTKEMLREIRPQTVADLVKISGLSHGTGVWRGNARDFMLGSKQGYEQVPFKQLIGCRDDIMVYLMSCGIPAESSFAIMESVRKGKGLTAKFENLMRAYNVPDWYIDSCKSIQYMFPKAHAAAYVIMALRIGWFKVHRPIYYYAGFFSRRADAFDIDAMIGGWNKINARINELDHKKSIRTITTKESDSYDALLLALEMTARGYRFLPIDIVKSDSRDFLISEDKKGLIMPFSSLDSLGENTAKTIVEARNSSPFTSKKDVMRRTKINSTVFERMNQMGIFEGLPEDDQLGLFNDNSN